MGWILVHNGTQQRLVLRPGMAQVGRAQTAQIRTMHQSVSRIHAEIVVEQHSGSLADVRPLAVQIVDRSSTGHTFVSGRPSLGRGTPTPLADGDLLAFGVDPATYTLRWSPVVLSYSSRMPAQETQAMEALARTAGAFLTPEWTQDCTHLLMEQLAITPKLLCCVADGGVPVASTFLRTLAACELAGPLPDPAAHRPRPPVGVDAAYEGKLMACFETPRPRRSMLQGVWVIFGLRQAYDALSIALLHAGSQVHLLCTTEAQATKVAEDLKRSAGAHGAPREVWLVPGLEERLGALLAPPLRELGTRCLAVTHGVVVSGILAGSLEAVHAEATPFLCQAAPAAPQAPQAPQAPPPAASFPETQRQALGGEKAEGQGGRRAMPWSRTANGVAAVKQEEDSFPNTLQQPAGGPRQAPPVPPSLSVARDPTSLQMLPPQGGVAKRPAPDPGGGAPTRRRTPQQSELSFQPVPAAALGTVKEPQSHLASGLGGDFSTAGDAGRPKPEVRSGVPQAPAATVKTEPGVDEKPQLPPRPRTLVTLTQGTTSMSQAKNEPFAAVELSQQKLEVAELSQTKREQLPPPAPQARRPPSAPLVESSVAAAAAVKGAAAAPQPPKPEPPPCVPEPVKHPTGVWLQSLAAGTPSRPGLEGLIADVPRASWSPTVEVSLRERRCAGGQAKAERASGAQRRGFKAFRKAQGQLQRGRAAAVPLVPWAPALGQPLAEVFGSQPMDSQSQLPPAF